MSRSTTRAATGSLWWLGVLGVLAVLAPGRVSGAVVVPGHPRVWLTQERLVRLRGYADRNTVHWQRARAAADGFLGTAPGPNPHYEAERILPLALAYQVTGNPLYADKAIQYVMANATPANTIFQAEQNGYYYRSIMPAMAAGLDWCYDRMTPAQRQQVASWLMDRANAVWPETNPARATGWAVDDPANNYFWGFMMTWPAALAAQGLDPRAEYHIDLALTKWRTMCRPFLDGWGAGGVFAESTNYDSSFPLNLCLDAHFTATGQNLLTEPGYNFGRDSLYWRIYQTVPTFDFMLPLGDQSRVPTAPTSPFDLQRAVIPMLHFRDTPLAGQARTWYGSLPEPEVSWWFTRAWLFLFFDEEIAPVSLDTLPLQHFFPGPGIKVRRSSWSRDATYWGMWSGPLRESHQFHDQNGFMIYKGGWLAGDAAIWSDSGILQPSGFHNTFTFDGLGQTWQSPSAAWPEEAGRIVKQEDTAEYGYVAGSAAQAYVQEPWRGGTRVATDFVRKFVNVGADLFLIYDRVSLVTPGVTKEWHLHAKRTISTSGRSYRFDNGQYRLWGEALLPTTGVTLRTTAMNGGNSQRLTVHTNNNRATDHILNVMQVAPVGPAPLPSPTAVVALTGNMEGAVLADWLVMFGKSERVDQQVAYDVDSGTPLRHLLLDLLPDRDYSVTLSNLGTGDVSTNSFRTTAAGSLRIDAQPGSYRVLLTPSGADTTAPAAPTGLRLVSRDSQATATWDANFELDLAGYYVYRALAQNGPYERQNGAPLTTRSLTQTGLTNGVTYWYRVTAVDLAGNEGLPSVALSVVPGPVYTVSGRVTVGGASFAGVTVVTGEQAVSTASDGTYTLVDLPAGSHTIRAEKPGFAFSPRAVSVGPSRVGVDLIGTEVDTSEFVLGINLGGAAVQVDGNQWLSQAQATAQGLTVLNGATYTVEPTYPIIPAPPSQDVRNMLLTGVWRSNSTPGAAITMTLPVPDGNYLVYFWEMEDWLDSYRAMDIDLEGIRVASGIGDQTLGRWQRFGPYWATVSDGELSIDVRRGSKGVPQMCGIALYAVQEPDPPDIPRGGYSIQGRVTDAGAGLPGVTVTAGAASVQTDTNGAYTITGLDPGGYTVAAARPGYIVSDPVPVQLRSNLGGVDFTAAPVPPPVDLRSLVVTPRAVTGGAGRDVRVIVTLSGPAPRGGTEVTLTATEGVLGSGAAAGPPAASAVRLPASVTVPQGTTFASVPVNISRVRGTVRVTISAACGGTVRSAALLVLRRR